MRSDAVAGPGAFEKGRSKGFSIVVATDRDRGIGNKGDLPWPRLKGDMKFFRELTTCPDREAVERRWRLTSTPDSSERPWPEFLAELKAQPELPEPSSEKQNAVLMGRKTWDSLPDGFRPLAKRHNRIMTRQPRVVDADALEEDSSVSYTAEVLAGAFWRIPVPEGVPGFSFASPFPPDRFREIFVIGGGQIFAHAFRYLTCAHLYITEIDAVFECDTFFPEIPTAFARALVSPWIVENGIRYRFARHDRAA